MANEVETLLQPITLHDASADEARILLLQVIRDHATTDAYKRVQLALRSHVWYLITAHEFHEIERWRDLLHELRLKMNLNHPRVEEIRTIQIHLNVLWDLLDDGVKFTQSKEWRASNPN